MGIYIKKMEMPESCYYCPFADGVWQKDKRCLINGKEMPRDGRDVQQNHINCPLVPVPPHGRLKDYDRIMKEYDEWFSKTESREYENMFYALRMAINGSPTIIPPSGGKENE